MAKDLSGLLAKMDLFAHALSGGPRSPKNQAERPPQVLSVLFAYCLRASLAHTHLSRNPRPCPARATCWVWRRRRMLVGMGVRRYSMGEGGACK